MVKKSDNGERSEGVMGQEPQEASAGCLSQARNQEDLKARLEDGYLVLVDGKKVLTHSVTNVTPLLAFPPTVSCFVTRLNSCI